MNLLQAWAREWSISPAAIEALQTHLGLMTAPRGFEPVAPAGSEAAVQAAVRAEASRRGERVWRNNLGAYTDPESGQFVRYGLANDSKQLNEVIKSADLIGIRPITVTPADVGVVIGQFVSYECKHSGWRHRPNDKREQAQVAWASLVLTLGGVARFITGAGQI